MDSQMTAYMLRCTGDGCEASLQLRAPGPYEALALAGIRRWSVSLEIAPCPACAKAAAA